MKTLERPLPSMAPNWARVHPWIWSLGHGALGVTIFAGMVRFFFGGTDDLAWIAGALFGAFQFALNRALVNRGPWQPRWAGRIFNPRRVPPWVNGLLLIYLIPLTARPLSRGIIEGRLWEVLWGVEFLLFIIATTVWAWRYWSKVQVDDRAWLADRASAVPPDFDISTLKEAPPPLPGTSGEVHLEQAEPTSWTLASPLRRLAARSIDWVILFIIAASTADALVPSGDDDAWFNVLVVVFASVSFVSEVIPIALWGKTPGKLILGVKVARSDEAEPPGPGRSLIRWLAMAVLIVAFPFGLYSYLSLLWNKRKQTWYDKAAGTIVLRPAKRPRFSPPMIPVP